MPSACCAPNCGKSYVEGSRLFRFPKDAERQKRWLINMRIANWTPGSNKRICEVSFQFIMAGYRYNAGCGETAAG
jgi:hypothetical protein